MYRSLVLTHRKLNFKIYFDEFVTNIVCFSMFTEMSCICRVLIENLIIHQFSRILLLMRGCRYVEVAKLLYNGPDDRQKCLFFVCCKIAQLGHVDAIKEIRENLR